MNIVCGTDFSPSSTQTVHAAAHLAARTGGTLHLVHCLDLADHPVFAEARTWLTGWALALLRRQSDELRDTAAKIEIHVSELPPEDALRALASEVSASLIVVAAWGKGNPNPRDVGRTADRVAQRSSVPVLCVRDPAVLEAWLDASRPLRVVIACDRTDSAAKAAAWIADLRAVGPCEVTAVHFYWPPAEHERLGLTGIRDYQESAPEVVKAVKQTIREQCAFPEDTHFVVEPHMGRVGDRIAKAADELRADIVVVGAHQRGELERLWEGSVSRNTLRRAKTSVVVVPYLETDRPQATRIRVVVAATDFSAAGDAAVALAYATVAPGGTVHLIHVAHGTDNGLSPSDTMNPEGAGVDPGVIESTKAALRRLIPKAASHTVQSEVHVLAARHAADAIRQAAERLNADILCVGTHRRSGLANVLLGSVAQDIVTRTHRPVAIAQARRA